jgi:hypothetical protein
MFSQDIPQAPTGARLGLLIRDAPLQFCDLTLTFDLFRMPQSRDLTLTFDLFRMPGRLLDLVKYRK